MNIPWCTPNYWGREQEYVTDALASTWISGGAYVDRFEKEISAFADSTNVLAVSNGTSALHLVFLGLGIEAGDEVVIPGFAFLAAANIVLQMGGVPIFAEVDSETWCITAESIEKVITLRTKAVVVVHTYGNACEMDPILRLCEEYGVTPIEDAAESFGTTYKGRMTGAIADFGIYSFQATKTITTGEGGMVLTRRADLVDRLKLFRSHGMIRTRYWHEVAGHNFRLTNMQAALGCAQLECFSQIVTARRQMDATYRQFLKEQPGIQLQAYTTDVDPVPWAFAIRIDSDYFPQGRDMLIKQMMGAGIETRPGFYSANQMSHLYKGNWEIPKCDELSRQIISLPSIPTLSVKEIESICNALINFRA